MYATRAKNTVISHHLEFKSVAFEDVTRIRNQFAELIHEFVELADRVCCTSTVYLDELLTGETSYIHRPARARAHELEQHGHEIHSRRGHRAPEESERQKDQPVHGSTR
jgi:hypothetical protein